MKSNDPVKFVEHDNAREGYIVMADPERDLYYVQPTNRPEKNFIRGPFRSAELECV